MSKTKLRGGQQIQDITIVDIQISNTAAIQTTKLNDGIDFLKRDGLVVFTSSLNADGNTIENLGAPISSNDIARKIDVESAALGLNVKLAARVATTANVDLSSDLADGETIDGVLLIDGNRVLVKNQNNQHENGIYIVPASGAASRSSDADSSDKFPLNTFLFVSEGNINADTGWVSTNDGSFVLDTDDLIFTSFANDDLINSASNVGSGVGLFKQLNANDLEFYSLVSENNRLSITIDPSDRIDFIVNEANIDHNALANYSVDQHREINDSGFSSTDLWSADKISNELETKSESVGHDPANILVVDSFGELQSVELSGDLIINENGIVSIAPEIIKVGDYIIREVPSGNVDGVNDEFELEFSPVEDSLKLFVNGVLKSKGVSEDYTQVSKIITFNDSPEIGDKIRANYIRKKFPNFPAWDSSDAFDYSAFVSAFEARELEVNSQKSVNYIGSISMGSLIMRCAVVAPDGNIYGPNVLGGSMIKLNTSTDAITTFGSLPSGSYECCVLAQNGMIYTIASGGECYKIDPINEIITSLGNHNSGQFAYAALAPNGCIYSSPYNSTQMFKIDTSNDSISNFAGAFSASGGHTFGIGLGSDGNMYCAPHRSSQIVRINTSNDTTSTINTGVGGDFRWVGRCVMDTHGQMYFTADHADNTLVLNINTQNFSQVSSPGSGGPTRHRGGILSPYGSIFHGPATHPFLTETIPPSGNTLNVSSSPNFGTTTWKYTNPIISPQGNLYLLNYVNASNLQKFSLGGLSNYPLDFYLSPFVNHC